MPEDVGYGATPASQEPGTEHERPDPEEQREAAGQREPSEASEDSPGKDQGSAGEGNR